jgi:protoheme IX farnesyltransferase
MATIATSRSVSRVTSDYVALAKPWSIMPHFVTAASAMFLAVPGMPPLSTLLFTLIGGGFVAGAANTFNSCLDRDIDAVMARTRNRPLPSGRVTVHRAAIFGIGTGLVGVLILGGFVNWAAAVLSVIAMSYYVLPYTLWLKRRTYWSTLACSGIGAAPPLIGWIAVTNRLEMTPFLLSAIVVLWTMPHFWALTIFRHEDYELAGIRVMPAKHAARWAMLCSALLVALTIVLATVGKLGVVYLASAVALGTAFLGLSARLVRRADSRDAAKYLYAYSIVYITVLFGAIIVDRLAFHV